MSHKEVDISPNEDSGAPGDGIAMVVFAALSRMAERSPRSQADVQAALRRENLSFDTAELAAAIRSLLRSGLLQDAIPLSDGGVLVTVTKQTDPAPLPG